MEKFKTIKSAREAGYIPFYSYYYGGDRILIKGKDLIKDPQIALSATEWKKRGFKVKKGEKPHTKRSGYLEGSGYQTWSVFREDQLEPIISRESHPPKEVPLLLALHVVDNSARRQRDAASKHYAARNHGFAGKCKRQKKSLYELKAQALHYMIEEGLLNFSGYNIFGEDNWAEVWQNETYTFHRPCPEPEQKPETQVFLNMVQSEKKKKSEPRLKDAIFTLKKYLKKKPEVKIYFWPERLRPERFRFDFWQEEENYWEEESKNNFKVKKKKVKEIKKETIDRIKFEVTKTISTFRDKDSQRLLHQYEMEPSEELLLDLWRIFSRAGFKIEELEITHPLPNTFKKLKNKCQKFFQKENPTPSDYISLLESKYWSLGEKKGLLWSLRKDLFENILKEKYVEIYGESQNIEGSGK